MQNFEIALGTKTYFGEGILMDALDKEKGQIKGNLLVVTTGRSLIRHGHLGRLADCLRRMGGIKDLCVYDCVSPNPRLEEAMGAIEAGQRIKADVVIGFGGGSALDTAKAAAVGIPEEASLKQMEEYLLHGKAPGENTLPIIAVPTTAGTGSELSRGAILSSERFQVKSGIRGDNILPRVAIVDPEFTWTLPRRLTMETGFDVLAHGIESYVSKKANLFSETLSEKAISLAGDGLRVLGKNLGCHAARETMSYASMIMGMNLASVGTCLPHRIQYPVGSFTDTSHAAGLIAIYPAWMGHESRVSREKIKKVLELLCMGWDGDGDGVRRLFRNFLEELGIAYTLRDLGVKEEDVTSLAGKVTGNLANDRLYGEEGMIARIMEESI